MLRICDHQVVDDRVEVMTPHERYDLGEDIVPKVSADVLECDHGHLNEPDQNRLWRLNMPPSDREATAICLPHALDEHSLRPGLIPDLDDVPRAAMAAPAQRFCRPGRDDLALAAGASCGFIPWLSAPVRKEQVHEGRRDRRDTRSESGHEHVIAMDGIDTSSRCS